MSQYCLYDCGHHRCKIVAILQTLTNGEAIKEVQVTYFKDGNEKFSKDFDNFEDGYNFMQNLKEAGYASEDLIIAPKIGDRFGARLDEIDTPLEIKKD